MDMIEDRLRGLTDKALLELSKMPSDFRTASDEQIKTEMARRVNDTWPGTMHDGSCAKCGSMVCMDIKHMDPDDKYQMRDSLKD